MASSNEQRAYQLIVDAKKKLSSGFTFFGIIFWNSGSAEEEAADCYQQAANLYKMDKNWDSAAQAFLSAANIHETRKSMHDAATNYVDAAKCFRKIDIDAAIDALIQAVDIYTDIGRFTMAAKYHQSVAEIYESKGILFVDNAVQHYEKAADYYRGEEISSAANKCLLKVAQYSAQTENYQKAISIYNEVADSALQSSLLKYSCKEYMFRGALCHLAMDILDTQRALCTYVEMYPAFQDSREYKFVQTLIECMDDQDVVQFTETVNEYNRISSLDQWFTMMLLRIKRQFSDKPDLR